ncbi:MAG: SRPBCC family protein [Myxococcota bacterium]
MKKAVSIDISASADRVWTVAAIEFDKIGRWASNVSSSEGLSGPAAAGLSAKPPVAGRTCATPQGNTVEKLIAFDDGSKSFTYEISGDAMPGFVERATNTWTVESTGADSARLTMSVRMSTRGLVGSIMQPMMKVGMGKLLRVNLEELKHFIETGQPHARKRKQQKTR